jgi:hypothetical protein
VDPNCIQKGHDKFDGGAYPSSGCFEKLEAAADGGCFTNDDTATMETSVDNFVNSVVAAVDPSYPAPIIDSCSAGKKLCVAKLTYAVIRCFYNAEARSRVIDPVCIQKAEVKFDGPDPTRSCIGKLEGRYTCTTTNDGATLQSASEAFAHDVACDVDPYQAGCP